MFTKYLEEIGLSDKEAAVYEALLQVEHDSVANIAEKAKIKRTTVYPTLESLAKKGLVDEVILDKKTHYRAEPPERLETFIARRKVELDENSRRLLDIVPQLKSIQRQSGQRPVVTFFEGKEGILSGSESFSRYFSEDKADNKEMHLIYSRDLVNDIFDAKEVARFRSLRLQNKVKSRSVYTHTKGDLPKLELSERMRLDEKKYPILCDISVYKDLVRISGQKGHLYELSIKNTDIATTLRSIINFILNSKK